MTLRNSWGGGSLVNNLQRADRDAPVRAKNNLQLAAVSTLIFYSSVQGPLIFRYQIDEVTIYKLFHWKPNKWKTALSNRKAKNLPHNFCLQIRLNATIFGASFRSNGVLWVVGTINLWKSQEPTPIWEKSGQVKPKEEDVESHATQCGWFFLKIFLTKQKIMLCMKCRTFCRRVLFLLKSFF